MDWSLEVVVLPVSDIDRSIAFYRDQVGFHLDHDTQNEHMHVTQLTPPGSISSMTPFSTENRSARTTATAPRNASRLSTATTAARPISAASVRADSLSALESRRSRHLRRDDRSDPPSADDRDSHDRNLLSLTVLTTATRSIADPSGLAVAS
jgi:catechol 2,3-dioxygenase-like lactoylglutathione lyase family enzyme